MTTIFDGYDEEYRTLTSDIAKKISGVALCEDDKGRLAPEVLASREK